MYIGQVRVAGAQHQRLLGDVRKPGTNEGLTRAMAEARLREIRSEIEAEAGKQARDMTLRDAGERCSLKRATSAEYWMYLHRHLTGPQQGVRRGSRPAKSAPFFEDHALASITRADVNRYVDQKIGEGLGPRTLDLHLT